jgi:hypothetical protein
LTSGNLPSIMPNALVQKRRLWRYLWKKLEH